MHSVHTSQSASYPQSKRRKPLESETVEIDDLEYVPAASGLINLFLRRRRSLCLILVGVVDALTLLKLGLDVLWFFFLFLLFLLFFLLVIAAFIIAALSTAVFAFLAAFCVASSVH